MTKHIIKQDQTTQWHIDDSSDTWILAKDATITVSMQTAVYEDDTRSDNRIVIDGDIQSDNPIQITPTYGISTYGTNTRIEVNASAKVAGDTAVVMRGGNETLVNEGKLIGDDYGVETSSNSGEIINSGLIKGYQAVSGYQYGLHIVNAVDGDIKGTYNGIYYFSSQDLKIENAGLIKASVNAITDGDGDADITNTGIIKGNVVLGAGDDRFDTRGGKLIGEITGGDGSDTYIVDTSDIVIHESILNGSDAIRSMVDFTLVDNVEKFYLIGGADIDGTGTISADKLFGNGGRNQLSGLAGEDLLDGGKGNDRLRGGGDSDTFVFSSGDGHDVVLDFDGLQDRIDLAGMNDIKTYDDLMKNHVKVSDGDLTIVSGSDEILLKNVVKADLSEAGFDF
ncbi:MAG: hemolysin-type calcium-binding repeat family protein [Rhizobium sp.]|nr:hemolysin-type calcium-binding repeat family protein [Rhizobium sp.]